MPIHMRKVLRSDATSFEYARAIQPRPKLGPWDGDLDRMLDELIGTDQAQRLAHLEGGQ